MFNICSEPQNHKLEDIIQDYLTANKESENLFLQHVKHAENAFFNHWKQLNQLRIQSQSQNWSTFINQLQQLPSKPLHTNTNTNPLPLINMNINHNVNGAMISNTTITPLSIKPQSSLSTAKVNSARSTTTTATTGITIRRRAKPIEEFKCPRGECCKIYTTKGNLNRHLKDFHRLHADLIQTSHGIHQANDASVKVECNECSQCFIDEDALYQHENEIHNDAKALNHSVTPPKKPTPPQSICPAPPTITAPNAFTVSNGTNRNPFSASSHPKVLNLNSNNNNNNNNKAMHLPMFNVNRNNENKSTIQRRVNPFDESNDHMLRILANKIKNGGKVMHVSSIHRDKDQFNSMPKFIKNANNRNDMKTTKSVKGVKSMKSTYSGLDMLLQAADALDRRKSDSVSSDTTDESDDARRHRHRHRISIRSRKRKNASTDDDYDPAQDRNPAKRRKIINDVDVIKRVEADFKSGICTLCKKTQREKNTSNYNWKNHLESDHKYPCNECERRFTKPKYLDIHMQDAHPGMV